MNSFFKLIGIIVLVVIVLIVSGLIYLFVSDQIEKSLLAKVDITIFYDTIRCTEEYPLYVQTYNGTNKNLLYTNFDIQVYKPGYSSNIVSFSSYYSNNASDKIISPGGSYSLCYSVPTLTEEISDLSSLIYSVGYKRAKF